MRTQNTSIIWLAVLVSLGACREVYYPEDINSPEQIPVIQGFIQENGVPRVDLSWAMRYSGDFGTKISGAEVRISDDLGNEVGLQEWGNGYYSTNSGVVTGTVGRTYTLHVVLPDGSEYESSPELLGRNPSFDSLFADPGLKISYKFNDYNEPIEEKQKGLFIMADLSDQTDSVLYYRFNTRAVKEITFTLNPGTPGAITVYVWQTYTIDNIYNSNHTVAVDNRQALRDQPIGFLHFDYDPFKESVFATAPYPIGWIVICQAYSISAAAYEYYHSIALQLASNDQIFAPVPSQVKSTVHCLTDPGRPVIGVFEASSVSTFYHGFAWKDLDVYQSVDLNYFPEAGNGTTRPFPPDFWIPFH